MAGDDTELVALIDNELDEEVRDRLLARLEGNDELRKRYEELRDTRFELGNAVRNAERLMSGTPITQVRDGIYRVNVVARANDEERVSLSTLRSLQLPPPGGRTVPLSQAAFEFDQGFPRPWPDPIAPTVFWGPLAFAIVGGLFVATLLALLVLPNFYITLYRAKQPEKEAVAA
jgi:Cu/Ag efflux pump CusA